MSALDARRRVRLAVAGVVVPGAAWAIGVNWMFCLLLAGAGAAAVAILELPRLAQEPNWPAAEEARRGGGRREVTSLSWMLTSRHGGTDRAAVLRLREIARRRLAQRGIDLDSPADRGRAVDALGADVLTILISDGSSSPSHRQLVQCIESLERLDPRDSRDRLDSVPPTRTSPEQE
jgi:hypothetical protein